MAWVVTLQIIDCSSPSKYLSFASLTDGFNLYFADVNGQFIATVDDFYYDYVISISKESYVTRTYALSKEQAGSIQKVCLNLMPPPTSQGGRGGW